MGGYETLSESESTPSERSVEWDNHSPYRLQWFDITAPVRKRKSCRSRLQWAAPDLSQRGNQEGVGNMPDCDNASAVTAIITTDGFLTPSRSVSTGSTRPQLEQCGGDSHEPTEVVTLVQ